MKTILSSIFAFLFLVSCANESKLQPQNSVDPKKVKTLLMAESSDLSESCASELKAKGHNILYKNDSGLLMTDSVVAPHSLKTCEIIPNQTETLDTKKNIKSKSSEPSDTLLSLIPAEEIGARAFITEHPEFDGRGVIIGVIDTGVELDHPMLRKTTEGAPKIINVQDFSGEGRVKLSKVVIDEEAKFPSPNGDKYSVSGIAGTEFNFGIFQGSTLNQGTDAAEGDKFTDIGVLTYQTNDNQIFARLDTNGDRDFSNDVALSSYGDSRQFVKLGEKKTLTTAITILDPENVSLFFDDGSHGTHVSGIAAGNDPSGLTGVAPGAQLVVGKIGDARLSGGSTTTAAKFLAIDFVVKQRARIINISYGIRGGSNLGESAIDRYIDRIAKEKDVLFSVSAGNSGPGILTIGTPAGASLALSVGAYVSKKTSHQNYGYTGVETDNLWYFSSIGPLLGGGLKPSLIAPGSAISSLPLFTGGFENYRGTSMAAPEVSGGLALLLSAANQSALPVDRATITHAVLSGATPLSDLKLVEQGHGLMNVPAAFEKLALFKDESAIEYTLSVNSPTSPTGKGSGIFLRGRDLENTNFRVTVPASSTPPLFLRTYQLRASADWIEIPQSFWLNNGPKTFQVNLLPQAFRGVGLVSEKIEAIDETNGEVAFTVPVTLLLPTDLDRSQAFKQDFEATLKPGKVERYFIHYLPGTTSTRIRIESEGAVVVGELHNGEGVPVLELRDAETTLPLPPLNGQINIDKPGVYELVLFSQPYNPGPAKVRVSVEAYSLAIKKASVLSPTAFELEITNSFAPLKFIPKIVWNRTKEDRILQLKGNLETFNTSWTKEDQSFYSGLAFRFVTSKIYYDLMTDYPYRVFCPDGTQIDSGGLELDTVVAVAPKCDGPLTTEVQGAFTEKPPVRWSVQVEESRFLKNPVTLLEGKRTLLQSGQSTNVIADFTPTKESKGLGDCSVLRIEDTESRTIQETDLCGL